MGLMGKGDVFIIAMIVLIHPSIDVYDYVLFQTRIPKFLPPVYLIVLYSALITVVFTLVKSIYYLIVYRGKLPCGEPLRLKILMSIIGRPMSVEEFLKSKHYYPLTIIERGVGGVVRKYRLSFDAEHEDYKVHQENYRRLIEEGVISKDDVIWVTYGIPHIVPLTIGYVLFLIIGDYPFKIIIDFLT